MIKKAKILTILFVVLGLHTVVKGGIIYVDDDATPPGDGASWETAFTYLQDALMVASSGHEIRVAQGIYRPDDFVLSARPNLGREETFFLKDGVTIKGGYAGLGEPDPNARNVGTYETILSGDLDSNDVDVNDPADLLDEPTRAENSYHVVTGSGTEANSILDGFNITGGNASATDWNESSSKGGGMYNYIGSPTVTNCNFLANSATNFGGGMFNLQNSSPTVTNCTFIGNSAYAGGGMSNYGTNSRPTVTNCTFSGNSAFSGGGMYTDDYTISYNNPIVTKCSFNNNSAKYGGGMLNSYSSPTVTDCTFSDNEAEHGGGMLNAEYSNPMVKNCTFTGNKAHSPSADCGGGMHNVCSSPMVTNCTFSGNLASGGGGGIFHGGGSPMVTNCTFSGNLASAGGGMSNYGTYSMPTVTNCTFSGNSAFSGGGMYTYGIYSRPIVIGCIFWSNTANEITLLNSSTIYIAYCDVQGGQTGIYNDGSCTMNWGSGNVKTDPCFVDVNNGDYHLKSQAGRWDTNSKSWVQDDVTSPCIDAGNPYNPIGLEPFPNGGIINMGAYGGTSEASKSYFGKPPCEIIVAGDVNGDCVINFLDFRLMALHWLEDNSR